MTGSRRVPLVLAVVARTLLGAILWWVLAEGRSDYAVYGLLAVPLGVAASLLAVPPGRRRGRLAPRAVALVRLGGFYLGRMVVGGVDIARRALRTPVDVDPVVLEVPVRLPRGTARDIALAMFNVMPGSLVQRQGEASAVVHVIAADVEAEREWRRLEERVARVAGIDLE